MQYAVPGSGVRTLLGVSEEPADDEEEEEEEVLTFNPRVEYGSGLGVQGREMCRGEYGAGVTTRRRRSSPLYLNPQN